MTKMTTTLSIYHTIDAKQKLRVSDCPLRTSFCEAVTFRAAQSESRIDLLGFPALTFSQGASSITGCPFFWRPIFQKEIWILWALWVSFVGFCLGPSALELAARVCFVTRSPSSCTSVFFEHLKGGCPSHCKPRVLLPLFHASIGVGNKKATKKSTTKDGYQENRFCQYNCQTQAGSWGMSFTPAELGHVFYPAALKMCPLATRKGGEVC